MPNSRPSDLYSDAHPEYEEPEEVAPPDKELETEETATAPSTDIVKPIPSTVAESYVMKIVLFAVVLALVAWYISRRRSGYKALETEKSIG